MNVMNYVRIGGEVFAVGASMRQLRKAREEGDNLRLLEAAVHFLAIAVTIAILLREIRNRRNEDSSDEDLE
jgi:hypothetical protein